MVVFSSRAHAATGACRLCFVVDTPLLSRFVRISPAFVDAAAAHSSVVAHRFYFHVILDGPDFFSWTDSFSVPCAVCALRPNFLAFWFPAAPFSGAPYISVIFDTYLL